MKGACETDRISSIEDNLQSTDYVDMINMKTWASEETQLAIKMATHVTRFIGSLQKIFQVLSLFSDDVKHDRVVSTIYKIIYQAGTKGPTNCLIQPGKLQYFDLLT